MAACVFGAVGAQQATQGYEMGGPLISRGSGAQGRNRTTDTAIFSRMLYQLSYLGGSSKAGRALEAPANRLGEVRGL